MGFCCVKVVLYVLVAMLCAHGHGWLNQQGCKTQNIVKGPKSLPKWGMGWPSQTLCLWNFSWKVRESWEVGRESRGWTDAQREAVATREELWVSHGDELAEAVREKLGWVDGEGIAWEEQEAEHNGGEWKPRSTNPCCWEVVRYLKPEDCLRFIYSFIDFYQFYGAPVICQTLF